MTMKRWGALIMVLLGFSGMGEACAKTSFTGQSEPPEGALNLWYRQPAEKEWTEALPVGNGRLGAMVFGGIPYERIQFNEETLWDGYPRDRINPKALEALPKVRQMLFDGENEAAATLAGETMMGIPERINSYQTFGDLRLEFPAVDSVERYRRRLDLETGLAETRYTIDGVTYTRTVFATHPHQLIVVRIEADQPGKVDFKATLDRIQDAECRSDGDCDLVLEGQIDRKHHETGEVVGMRFLARLRVLTDRGSIENTGGTLTVQNADAAVLLLSPATNYQGRDPETAARAPIDAAPDYPALLDAHLADHRALFSRVHLDLGPGGRPNLPTDARLKAYARSKDDPGLIALYFQFGRYLLMGSSRPGDLPANLQGVWNEHIDAPWNSDYHTNINLQMNYWPAEVANLAECHLPLFDYMDSLVPSGEKTAQAHYGSRGWVVHHLSDIFGFTVPADGIWGIWPMGAAWLAQHPYEHYLFNGDRAFLEQRAYPLMKGVALFMLDFLVEDPQGRLVTNPSHSPENKFRKADGTQSYFTYGATMDLMIVHEIFTNCIEAATILDIDPEFRAELAVALERLAPLQISARSGRLQEWIEDYDEPEPGHRHMSHFYGFHPGRQITLRGTPDLATALRKSLDYRLSHGGGHTGWSRAWVINFFARFEDPEKAYENLHALLARSTLPNLFDTHPPFQIDGNFGGTAGIAEMLLQSHAGYIRLLPALPEAWPTGKATGLRARGGYTVDQYWREGRLERAAIHASQTGTCKLRVAQHVTIEGITAEPVYEGGTFLIAFPVEAGKSYTVIAAEK
jgi:alpha-L-fucosidase 2